MIEPRGESEVWIRRFGDKTLTTIQWAGPDGFVRERFGILEFSFELQMEGRTLRHTQRAAALSIGGVRLPIPCWLAPQVDGSESASINDDLVHVQVKVRFPVLGLLFAYNGAVDCTRGDS